MKIGTVAPVLSTFLVVITLFLGTLFLAFPTAVISALHCKSSSDSDADADADADDTANNDDVLMVTIMRLAGGMFLIHAMNCISLIRRHGHSHGMMNDRTSVTQVDRGSEAEATLTNISNERMALISQTMLGLLLLLLGVFHNDDDGNIGGSLVFVGIGSFIILIGCIGLMVSFYPHDHDIHVDVVQDTPNTTAMSEADAQLSRSERRNARELQRQRRRQRQRARRLRGSDNGDDEMATAENTVPLLSEEEISLQHEEDGDGDADVESNLNSVPIQETGAVNQSTTAQTSSSFQNRITGTKRLIKLAGPQSFYLYAGCIVLIIRLPFSLSIPHFVSETLGALGRANYAEAKLNIILLFALGTVDAALDFWCVFLFGLTNLKITRGVRVDTFAAILRQEMAFFDITKSGDLASRLNSDCGEMGGDLTWFFRFSIESVVRIVSIVSYMLYRSPRLGICAISVVPLVAAINKRYGDWLNQNAKDVQTALAEANSVAQEAFSCIRTIVAFATEEHEFHKYEEKIENHYKLNVKQLYAQGFYYMAISTFLVNTVVQALLLYVGMVLIRRGQLSSEVLLAFMLYQSQLQNEVMNLFNSYTSLIKSSGAGDKVFELLDRVPMEPATGASTEGTRVVDDENQLNINLRQVDFTYPSRPDQKILDGLELDVPAGKTLALVGKSGCGKSTVMGLLQRFYDPHMGSIIVNGKNLRQLDIKSHRRKIGIVTQEPILFTGTIRSNIIYGKEDATDAEVLNAAKLANAHTFIERFPDGYNTQVGERGIQLSGGQKQRIAIARAIISKPLLLLLDEATSSLDTESEKLVQEALDHLLNNNKQMTTVVIAHRLQTIRNADRIAVLGQGNVQELGNHDELMQKGGIYHDMVISAEDGKLHD